MITNFKVVGFKKFKEFEIKNLGRINLLLGKNNVGKTSLLEALFAFACGNNFEPFLNSVIIKLRHAINEPIGMYELAEKIHTSFRHAGKEYRAEFRGEDEAGAVKTFKHIVKPAQMMSFVNSEAGPLNSSAEHFMSIYDGKTIKVINIAEWIIKEDDVREIKHQISLPQMSQFQTMQPAYNANFLDMLSHRSRDSIIGIYSALKRDSERMAEFIREMQLVFPEIRGIDMIPYKDGFAPVSIVKESGELLPIYQFGDGLQRWFYTIGSFVLERDSIKIIEELDATLHFGAQKKMGAYMSKLSRDYNAQVFASTHSIEFVENFLTGIRESYPEELRNVRVITMLDEQGEILSGVLTGEQALESVEVFNMELR